VRGQGLKLVSDNGCRPSFSSFLNVTATLDIEQIFTSYNNPKGNAETERFMRSLKEEILWLEGFAACEWKSNRGPATAIQKGLNFGHCNIDRTSQPPPGGKRAQSRRHPKYTGGSGL
jgi:transposase InsO family protein